MELWDWNRKKKKRFEQKEKKHMSHSCRWHTTGRLLSWIWDARGISTVRGCWCTIRVHGIWRRHAIWIRVIHPWVAIRRCSRCGTHCWVVSGVRWCTTKCRANRRHGGYAWCRNRLADLGCAISSVFCCLFCCLLGLLSALLECLHKAHQPQHAKQHDENYHECQRCDDALVERALAMVHFQIDICA